MARGRQQNRRQGDIVAGHSLTTEPGSERAYRPLPRRPHGHAKLALLCALAALLAWLLGQVIDDEPWQMRIAPAALTIAAGLLVAVWVRDGRRAERYDPLVLGINRACKADFPSRDVARLSRWTTRFGVGYPQRIRVQYDPGTKEASMPLEVIEVARLRTDRVVDVIHHDVERCRLVLAVGPKQQEIREARSEQERRVEGVGKKVLGPSATVDIVVDEDKNVTSFTIHHPMDQRLTTSGAQRRIDGSVSTLLGGKWRGTWDSTRDQVDYRLMPELPRMIRNEPLELKGDFDHQAYLDLKIPIAMREDGETVYWRPRERPHVLVAGGTGSGKTSFLHSLTTQLAALPGRVLALDGKRVEFVGFRDWPNVEVVASRVGAQVAMINYVKRVMDERYDLIESGKGTVAELEPLWVVIDEFTAFREEAGDLYAQVRKRGESTKLPTLREIAQLARLARTSKIHLIVGMQRPDAEFLAGEARDNFDLRISLGGLSPDGARMMWNHPGIGVARVPKGQGLALGLDGQPERVLFYFTPPPNLAVDEEDLAQLDRLRPKETRYERKVFRVPEPEEIVDEETDEVTVAWPSFRDYQMSPLEPYSGLDTSKPIDRSIVANDEALDREADELRAKTATAVLDAPAQSTAGLAELGDDWGYSNLADEYDDAIVSRPEKIAGGELILVDPDDDLWGIVISCDPDVDDDAGDCFVVSYELPDTGEQAYVSFNDGEEIELRLPKNPGLEEG